MTLYPTTGKDSWVHLFYKSTGPYTQVLTVVVSKEKVLTFGDRGGPQKGAFANFSSTGTGNG